MDRGAEGDRAAPDKRITFNEPPLCSHQPGGSTQERLPLPRRDKGRCSAPVGAGGAAAAHFHSCNFLTEQRAVK